ncbi:MAG: GNAT family N-acetyltransferase [Hyphomicrobiales bacterium]
MLAFRPPGPGDVEGLAALHVRCWYEAYGGLLTEAELAEHSRASRAAQWQRILADPVLFTCVALVDDVPAGFIVSGPARALASRFADGEIRAVYVIRAQQRRGIGGELFRRACADWCERGGQSLAILAFAGNAPALAFYRRMGAADAGVAQANPARPELADMALVWSPAEGAAGAPQ